MTMRQPLRGRALPSLRRKAWHGQREGGRGPRGWRPVNRGIWRGGEGLAFEWRMPEFDSYFRKLAVFAY